jgi:hypothetical protein
MDTIGCSARVITQDYQLGLIPAAKRLTPPVYVFLPWDVEINLFCDRSKKTYF